MTKNTTRKKAEPKQQAAAKSGPQPMDPSSKERLVGAPSVNNQRVCYALKTLVSEVRDLFPETPVEYSNLDGRNTALDASFDTTGLTNDDAITFYEMLALVSVDERVEAVITEDDIVLVSIRSSLRTQDLRDSFGLRAAYAVLMGVEGSL